MATKTIAQLAAASSGLATDLYEIDNGASQKLTGTQLAAMVAKALNLRYVETPLITLTATDFDYQFAHGFGSAPKIVKAVFVQNAADANIGGYAGLEWTVESFMTVPLSGFAAEYVALSIMGGPVYLEAHGDNLYSPTYAMGTMTQASQDNSPIDNLANFQLKIRAWG